MSSTDENEHSILEDGVDTDARAGRSLGIDLEGAPIGVTEEEVAAERERRLDPDNRPDGAEVDNTGRTFDSERGAFTDSEVYDEAEPRFDDAAQADTTDQG